MALKLKITQVKSGVGRSKQQNLTLKGLGLRGPHHHVVLQDSLSVRGMLRKVHHLIAVESAD